MTDSIIRILCVDDTDRIRTAWERLLALQPDMQVVGSVASGANLLEMYTSMRPDVVILDLHLAGGSAFSLLQDLFARDPHARVLIYSGDSTRASIDRCINAGAWGFVGKERSPEEVLRAIRCLAAGQAVFPVQGS